MFREVVRGVARNTSIMLLQYILTWGSSFVAMMFIPRYLGPVDYGRLYLASSVVALFRVFVEYGGNYLVAKEVSRNPGESGRILVDAVAFRLVLAVAAFGGVLLTAGFGGYPTETNILLLLCGLGLFGHGAVITLNAMFQGHEKLQYSSTATVVNSVFGNSLSIAAVVVWRSAWLVALIGVTASTLQLLVMCYYSRRLVATLPRVRWSDAWRQMKVGVPYFLFTVFSIVYYRIDAVMLSKLAPEPVVGWYGGACKLFEAMNFFPYLFSTAVYPVFSRLWKEEGDTHRRATQKSLEFMVIIGIPISIGLAAFARIPVQILYGLEEYTPAVLILQVLAGGLLFLFIDMVLGTMLLASDRQKQQAILALSMIPVNAGMNLLLIPFFQRTYGNGAIGAAIATGLTEAVMMVAMIMIVPKGVLAGIRLSVVYKSVAAGGVMAMGIALMSGAGIPLLMCAVLSPVLYGLPLMILKTLEPEEERVVRSLMTPRGLLSAIRFLRPDDRPGRDR